MHASDVVKENLMEIHVNYHYRMIKLKNQKLETIFLMIYDDDLPFHWFKRNFDFNFVSIGYQLYIRINAWWKEMKLCFQMLK